MSILEALRKLITKRGGTPKGSNIAEMISNYANEDNPSPSGGGEPLFVTGVTEGTLVTMDKTWNEIKEAFLAGRTILFGRDETLTESFYNVNTVIGITGEDDGSYPQYAVQLFESSTYTQYTTHEADGYPSYSYD